MAEEELRPGLEVERGEDGQFKRVRLSPERAAAMGRMNRQPLHAETSGDLLTEAGYTDPSDAPEHLRLLAEIASSKRSGAVPALRDFRRLVGVETGEASGAPFRVVSPYTLEFEGHYYHRALMGDISPETARALIDGLRRAGVSTTAREDTEKP